MTERVAVVTGASSGFGLLVTVELAKKGFHVYATMRNLQKSHCISEAVPNEEVLNNITFFPLDVTKEDSIASFQNLVGSLDRIDVLVNNAGFAAGGFCEEIDVNDYRDQFETNVFGVMAVTQVVLPVMRTRQQGTIINMSSISGRIGFPGLSPYVSSKHALEGYSESLRLEMKPFGVNVALVEPGSYKTNIWSTGRKVSERSLQSSSPYQAYMKQLEKQLSTGEKDLGNPLDVANLVVALAEKTTIYKLRHPIGKGVSMILRLRSMLTWRSWEKALLKKINVRL
ncbi:SDR family oxidoreductase [Pontibacillus salicampi]|uniref:SDR family oxidoreductase n=1 Tax=Pontibacillus salicampi TaxID=1449801 RepID=A0ABV6LPR0_9BACI